MPGWWILLWSLSTAEGAGMLVELRVGEQRYRAVWEVLEGASVIEVARRFGVSRQSVHSWLTRYAADGGLGGLGDRSSRPHEPSRVSCRIVSGQEGCDHAEA